MDKRDFDKMFGSNQLKFGGGMTIVIAIAVLIFISQSFVVIEPGQRGVSVTLGKVDENVRQEGVSFKMPFIEQVYRYNVKQLTKKGMAACYSDDLQTVNVEFTAFYEIPSDKVALLHREYQGEPYDAIVNPLIQDALKQVVSNYRAEDAVKRREEVRDKATEMIRQALQQIASDRTGKKSETALVKLIKMPITNIELTDELEHAIELKQITEQEALAKQYELQKARKQAEITLVAAEADAKALQIKSDAIRNAPRILDLEMKKLELDMTDRVLRKWNGQSPTTVVVGEGGGNVLLPLR